jgi:hypothetical protein
MKPERDVTRRAIAPDLIIDPMREPMRQSSYRSPMVANRVALLEREAPRIIDLGRSVGVDLTYEGIAPMFNEPVVYAGDDTDWVIGPVGVDEVPVIPREQLQAFTRLEAAGATFPAIYVAHEINKGNFPGSPEAPTGTMATVDPDHAAYLVGRPPLPADSLKLADRLDARAAQVFRAMRQVGIVAGTAAAAIAAAPLRLVGSAVGALANLDPVVFGVIPAVSPRVGEPAAWYVLARWDW